MGVVIPFAAIAQTHKAPRVVQPPSLNRDSGNSAQPDIAGVGEGLLRARIIILSGEISQEIAETVIAQLIYLEQQAPGKDIYLYINSPGGEISSGLAIFDTMRSLQSDVVTISIGSASSMASILLAGGTKGKRYALPNTRIMSHQPLGGAFGRATDVETEARELLYYKKRFNQILAELTGQPERKIAADSERDFYLSAQAAKAYGLIDQVINQLPGLLR